MAAGQTVTIKSATISRPVDTPRLSGTGNVHATGKLPAKTNTNKTSLIHMAKYTLIMENPNTGIIKKAPVGFSWTTLFFGGIPALTRGDAANCFWQILLYWTLIFPVFVYPFIYNKIFIKKLLKQGFKVDSIQGAADIETASRDLGINLPLLNPPKPQVNTVNS